MTNSERLLIANVAVMAVLGLAYVAVLALQTGVWHALRLVGRDAQEVEAR